MGVTQELPRHLSERRRYADHRNLFAGICYRETAPKQKQIALAEGLHESTVSRGCNGDPTGSAQRFYQTLHRLASNPKTDPSPLLAGAFSVVEEASVPTSPEDLREQILPLMDAETEAQMTEDLTSHRVLRLLERWGAGDRAMATLRDMVRALFLWETALRRETSKQIQLETRGRMLRLFLQQETGFNPDLRR
jgi:hypothetical protein